VVALHRAAAATSIKESFDASVSLRRGAVLCVPHTQIAHPIRPLVLLSPAALRGVGGDLIVVEEAAHVSRL
jgi:hypothetical protein